MAKINFGGVILLLADDHTVTMRCFVKLAKSKKSFLVLCRETNWGKYPYERMTKRDLWDMEGGRVRESSGKPDHEFPELNEDRSFFVEGLSAVVIKPLDHFQIIRTGEDRALLTSVFRIKTF